MEETEESGSVDMKKNTSVRVEGRCDRCGYTSLTLFVKRWIVQCNRCGVIGLPRHMGVKI